MLPKYASEATVTYVIGFKYVCSFLHDTYQMCQVAYYYLIHLTDGL